MKKAATDLQQDYLEAIALTAKHMAPNSPARAVEVFSKYVAELEQKPGLEFAELRVIALLSLSRVQRAGASQRTREEAIAIFDALDGAGGKLTVQDGLADTLIDFGEYRRAIQPCEQAIRLSGPGAKLANRLWRAGRTYLRAGLKPHAEDPLRKAAAFFRVDPDAPQTPVILNDLGNALRSSNPQQAETAYREAAVIWERKGSPAQATTAWVNLGVLFAEQGRLPESLQWYEKARRVRQADPTTPRARLGGLANNIANLYRRMKKFDLAAQEAEQAISLLEGDPLLAEAFGTYGQILRDQGSDEAALDWFRRSRAEHARQPSPDLDHLTEALDEEAAALRRLGRPQEAVPLEQEAAGLRGGLPPLVEHPPPQRPAAAKGEVRIELDGANLPPDVYRDCDLTTLENRLEEALHDGQCGALDGHETGPQTTTLFLYGPDPEALYRAIEPVLRDYPLCHNAKVTIVR